MGRRTSQQSALRGAFPIPYSEAIKKIIRRKAAMDPRTVGREMRRSAYIEIAVVVLVALGVLAGLGAWLAWG